MPLIRSRLINGPELISIAETARDCGVFVSIGFNEGTSVSGGCIWNANVVIGDDGRILCHHRKIVPTFYEKLIWAPGDGGGLRVCEIRLGRLGILTLWRKRQSARPLHFVRAKQTSASVDLPADVAHPRPYDK